MHFKYVVWYVYIMTFHLCVFVCGKDGITFESNWDDNEVTSQ